MAFQKPKTKIYNEQNKLDSLTPEQLEFMEEVKQKWIDKFYRGDPIDRKSAKESVAWLYKNKLNLEPPEICVVSSPLSAQYATNLFLNNKFTREQAQECGDLANKLVSLKDDGRAQFKSICEKVNVYNSSNFLCILDWGWVAYYSFFQDIGVDYGDSEESFSYFRQLLEAGVYSTLLLDEVCILVECPVEINKNAEGRGHNANGPAFRFRDNFGIYYLNGISFGYDGDCELYMKLTSGQMTFAEIMQIPNIDQRSQAMRFSPPKDFLQENKAKLIDHYEKTVPSNGNTVWYDLMRIPQGELFSEDAYYIYYNCPSTGKEYISGVIKCSTVAEGMAWKFKCTPEEWMALKPEVTES